MPRCWAETNSIRARSASRFVRNPECHFRRLFPVSWSRCSFGSKLPGAVARIAALIHVAKSFRSGWQAQIDASAVRSAIEIGRFYVEHTLVAIGFVGADTGELGASKILGWIRRARKTEFSKRDVHQA